jgi:hypothetical protein
MHFDLHLDGRASHSQHLLEAFSHLKELVWFGNLEKKVR